ncbi:MAG: zinc ribbon domain-containing protein YjdM [Candidatus Nanopelagicales bacterium]
MSDDALPACPECSSIHTYEMGALLVCPECGHEWSADAAEDGGARVVRDAVGNVLVDGDDVTIVKDVKVKGAGGGSIKIGTKVRGIRIVDGVGDHDLEARVEGFGPMQLKSSVVKKA